MSITTESTTTESTMTRNFYIHPRIIDRWSTGGLSELRTYVNGRCRKAWRPLRVDERLVMYTLTK